MHGIHLGVSTLLSLSHTLTRTHTHITMDVFGGVRLYFSAVTFSHFHSLLTYIWLAAFRPHPTLTLSACRAHSVTRIHTLVHTSSCPLPLYYSHTSACPYRPSLEDSSRTMVSLPRSRTRVSTPSLMSSGCRGAEVEERKGRGGVGNNGRGGERASGKRKKRRRERE
mmetsp:Transcript_24615/g.62313  ORF Transcript_24615/g.62313 Transcript_24615/m.62313 type:complete len:167 (-) Transcript_24615:137-637(-)